MPPNPKRRAKTRIDHNCRHAFKGGQPPLNAFIKKAMNLARSLIKPVGLAALLVAACILPTLWGAQDSKAAAAASSVTACYTAAETAEFKRLTQATLKALAASQESRMVACLTDLETAWDDQETVLRPKNEATWMRLDKALDRGISALRSSHPNPKKGEIALKDLLRNLDQATLDSRT